MDTQHALRAGQECPAYGNVALGVCAAVENRPRRDVFIGLRTIRASQLAPAAVESTCERELRGDFLENIQRQRLERCVSARAARRM